MRLISESLPFLPAPPCGFFAMSDRLSFLVLLAVVLAIGGWLFFHGPDSPIPAPCNCRELADQPTTYAGRVVCVSTAGTQCEGKSLVWRRASHLSPAVVLRGTIPDPVPPTLTGTCRAPFAGGPVTVLDCRP